MSTPNGRLARLEKETGTKDVVAADEWWQIMTDERREAYVVQRIAFEGHAGVYLAQCRCPHHLSDCLREVDWVHRCRLIQCLREVSEMLERRGEPTIAALFAFLGALNERPGYHPRTALDPDFVDERLKGLSAERRAAASEAWDHPLGPPAPPCPLCEPEAAPRDPALATLTRPQWSGLLVLGYALCFDGDAPDLAGQVAWIIHPATIPARYRAVVDRARADADALDRRLFGAADTPLAATA